MSLARPARSDALRPTAEAALDAWAARVRDDRAQVERCREIDDPADFYAPVAERFRMDPRRDDDPVLEILRGLARADDAWLDIGAGGGRYALPLALSVREVTAIDPSPAMLDVLRAGMKEHRIRNLRVELGRWPSADREARSVDVALMAHVGYDIEDIGPFLDAAERVARRTCVAVVGEAAMTTVASLFWAEIHGEPRVPLPALPELVTLLMARGRMPGVALAPRSLATFPTFDDLLSMARRQLWVRPGSARERRLAELVRQRAVEGEAGWTLETRPARIGVVAWEPPGR
jgi:SAM-dependent methyltransferase